MESPEFAAFEDDDWGFTAAEVRKPWTERVREANKKLFARFPPPAVHEFEFPTFAPESMPNVPEPPGDTEISLNFHNFVSSIAASRRGVVVDETRSEEAPSS